MDTKHLRLSCCTTVLLALGMVLSCGCRSVSTLRVTGTFPEVWDTAQHVVTNADFVILTAKAPEPAVSRRCGLIEGRRTSADPVEGEEGFLSRREPWEQVRVQVCPVKPESNRVVRTLKVTASTERTDLMLLRGRTQRLPQLERDVTEALLRAVRNHPGLELP